MRILRVALVALSLWSLPVEGAEIAYDDGTAERDIIWNVAGNGVAVRFTVEPGSVLQSARVWVGVAAFLNPLGICVLRANGPGGAPGDTLVGYFRQSLHGTRFAFADVTLATQPVIQDGDFYVVSLQTGAGSGDATSVGLDTSSPPDGRSWVYEGGAWSILPAERGDAMIRATISEPTPVASGAWAKVKQLYRCRGWERRSSSMPLHPTGAGVGQR